MPQRRPRRPSGASGPRRRPPVRPPVPDREEETHVMSATAVAAEALSTGVLPRARVRGELPLSREAELLQAGDVDASPLGDESPGGSMSTPDHDRVDDIGRAYGVADADDGELRPMAELLGDRDRRRALLEAPRPRRGTRGSDR